MRIVLVGQGPFGKKVLEALIKNGEDIVGVYCPKDKRGEALKALAESSDIALFQTRHMKDLDVLDSYRSLSPDLAILAFVTDIFPESLLGIPSIGTICYHPSLLPKHRGASGINWAVIQGDKRTGVTILWSDKGIDTGPILLQKEVDIGPDDTTGSLYFNSLFPLGIDAIIESVDLIKRGKAPKIPQDNALATYEPPCDDKVASIDWAKHAGDVYNLVRGCDPQPGAYSTLEGRKVRFYKSELLFLEEERRPGEIATVNEDAIIVALSGGVLKIGKIKGEEGGKMDAYEFAGRSGLKVGMRFGT
jgi:methionyl-tRNA formyltransferase